MALDRAAVEQRRGVVQTRRRCDRPPRLQRPAPDRTWPRRRPSWPGPRPVRQLEPALLARSARRTSPGRAGCARGCAAAAPAPPPARTAGPDAPAPRAARALTCASSSAAGARDVDPQRQRVDEEADQPFDLRPRAVGHRRADHHVVLARQPRQHRRPAAASVMNSVVPWRWLSASGRASAPRPTRTRTTSPAYSCCAGRGRSVGSSSNAGAPAQRAPPVLALRCQHLAGQPLPLPRRVVGVLNRQRRQRIACPAQKARYSALSSR